MDNVTEMIKSVPLASLKKIAGLEGPKDLTVEIYREYDYPSGRVYRISDPVALYYRNGGSTHRIVDSKGVVHCVTFGKYAEDVVLRWKNKEDQTPVNF
jgi:hypothetical protein